MPKTDIEYDNVHVITQSGTVYQYGFDGKINLLNQQEYSFQQVTQLYQKQSLVLEISPSEKARAQYI